MKDLFSFDNFKFTRLNFEFLDNLKRLPEQLKLYSSTQVQKKKCLDFPALLAA